MSRLNQFRRLVEKAAAYPDRRAAIQLTRLWNWADFQVAPEPYFNCLWVHARFMFHGPTVNDFKFCYAPLFEQKDVE